MADLLQQFGQIDIYLFDQLLRGRITPGMRILDAGCGGGRNLVYLIREGYEVFGVDQDPQAIEALPESNFKIGTLQTLPFDDGSFDVVICNAVLHFATDDRQFKAMLLGAWRVLKTGGMFFCRLASSIGTEKRVEQIAGRRFALPDGSERYLVDERLLLNLTKELNAELLDPIKTTVVQDQRSMTTWVLKKNR